MKKATLWLADFQGPHLVRAYRKKFRVNVSTAARELGELGALTPEQVSAVLKGEQARIRDLQERRARRQQEQWPPYQDGTFCFIAGYTSWGFPYGATWEQLQEDPPSGPSKPDGPF